MNNLSGRWLSPLVTASAYHSDTAFNRDFLSVYLWLVRTLEKQVGPSSVEHVLGQRYILSSCISIKGHKLLPSSWPVFLSWSSSLNIQWSPALNCGMIYFLTPKQRDSTHPKCSTIIGQVYNINQLAALLELCRTVCLLGNMKGEFSFHFLAIVRLSVWQPWN